MSRATPTPIRYDAGGDPAPETHNAVAETSPRSYMPFSTDGPGGTVVEAARIRGVGWVKSLERG